jgi:copper chaperone
MAHYMFKVAGMKCGGCTKKIKGLEEKVADVVSIEASWEAGEVQIEASVSAMTLKEEIESLGFSVTSFSKE